MSSVDSKKSVLVHEILTTETTIERFTPPRLGIIHLLAWIGTSAVLMKIVQWGGQFDSMSDRFPGWLKIFFIANTYFNLTMISAGIVGACVIIHARYRGNRGRLQAGHWLVLNITLAAAVSTSVFIVFRIIETWLIAYGKSANSPICFKVFFAALAMSWFIAASLWLLAAIRAREDYPWKALLGFLAIRASSTGMLHLFSVLMRPPSLMSRFIFRLPIGAALVLLFLSIAVMTDLSHGKKRDWLHWLGIAMLFITSISVVAKSVVFLLFDIRTQ